MASELTISSARGGANRRNTGLMLGDTMYIFFLRLMVAVIALLGWHYSVVFGLVPEFYVSTPLKTLNFLVG